MKEILKKVSVIFTTAIFVAGLFVTRFVTANHIPYQYDSNISVEENYKKAGHPELYQEFLDETSDKNYDTNTYEGKAQEILNKQNEYIIKNGEYQYAPENKDENLTYTLLVPLPQEGESLKDNVSLDEYLAWMYKFALYLAAFLAVMQITIGGVMFIASGANEKTRGAAKDKIWSAIYGLVLTFGAYLVLYTINPQLVSVSSKNLQSVNVKTDYDNNGEFKGGGGGEFGGSGATGSWDENVNEDTGIGENNRGVTDVNDLDFDFNE